MTRLLCSCWLFIFCHVAMADQASQLRLNESHVRLLRELNVVWDPTENGAPTAHRAMPFGSRDAEGDVAKILGLAGDVKPSFFGRLFGSKLNLNDEQRSEARRYLDEILPAMRIFLQAGRIEPGSYPLRVKKPAALWPGIVQVDFYKSEEAKKLVTMPPPELENGMLFELTAEHIKLLRHSSDFLELADEPEEGDYRVPGFDPKRPYGDMTYYPLDIAPVLGIPLDNADYDEDDEPPFELAKLKRLCALHLEMSAALLAFLQNAQLEPGLFERNKDREWRRSDAATRE